MAWRRPAAAVLATIVWLAGTAQAPAQTQCSCRIAADAQNAVAADVVFTGVALAGEALAPLPTTPAGASFPAPQRWSFMVESPIKGKPASPVDLVAGGRLAPCGFGADFEVGVRYLVFARRDGRGDLWTSVCTGTRDLDQEPRRRPTTFPGGADVGVVHNQAGRNALLVLASGGALALGLAAGYERRRRQQLLAPPAP